MISITLRQRQRRHRLVALLRLHARRPLRRRRRRHIFTSLSTSSASPAPHRAKSPRAAGPQQSTPPFALNSPVLDGASGNIFVADLNGTLSYVRETFSTVGTCKTGTPPCIGSTTVVPSQIHSLIDAPIVDSSTQKVFVFYANYDGTNMAVVQSDTALSAKVAALLPVQSSTSAICMRELSITPILRAPEIRDAYTFAAAQPLAYRRLCALASTTPPLPSRMQPAR